MKNKIFFGIVLLFFSTSIMAQQDRIKFSNLIKGLFENEMLSQRFYKDFLLVKANINKSKVFMDLDKSMARFDDNLSYVASYVVEHSEVEESFTELQDYWNLTRMSMLNFDDNNFDLQVKRLENLDKLSTNLLERVLKKDDLADENSDEIKIIKLATQNIRQSNKILITYLLEKKFKQDLSDSFEVDLSRVKKNIKKISKFQNHKFGKITSDLSNSITTIESLLDNESYHPKILMSNLIVFSKKNYQIFSKLISSLKN